jgi:hypothetical protein
VLLFIFCIFCLVTIEPEPAIFLCFCDFLVACKRLHFSGLTLGVVETPGTPYFSGVPGVFWLFRFSVLLPFFGVIVCNVPFRLVFRAFQGFFVLFFANVCNGAPHFCQVKSLLQFY